MEIGRINRPRQGEAISGDASIVIVNGDTTTVALADGLGHGPGAAQASSTFCAVIEQSPDMDLESLFRLADERLAHTRGAAAAVLRIDTVHAHLVYAGIGNIELKAKSQQRIAPISLPGILGRRIRKVRCFEYGLAPGDLLAVFSDGVSPRFDLGAFDHPGVKRLAEAIVDAYGKDHDDASCVVLRF